MNVGNAIQGVQFMSVKRSENLDAKELLRIDKIWIEGNPEDTISKPKKLGLNIRSFSKSTFPGILKN